MHLYPFKLDRRRGVYVLCGVDRHTEAGVKPYAAVLVVPAGKCGAGPATGKAR